MAAASSNAVLNRVVVVTGANKGIGYCIAEQLIEGNLFDRVIVACRDKTRGEEAALKLGPKAEFAQLDISDSDSINAFVEHMENNIGRCDGLVNNAAIAFKAADPTPFADQTESTLHINYFGTSLLTDKLIPLLRKSNQKPFITTIASMAGKLSQIKNDELRNNFNSNNLTKSLLDEYVNKFKMDVKNGNHLDQGWGNSNYGFSKLAIIAYCKMLARQELEAYQNNPDSYNMIQINWCCPGYCDTDMSSHKGPRSPYEGAKNATMLSPPSSETHGVFIQDYKPSEW
jgi:carbonyl reductase 1